jgi:hypothetical protein
MDFQNRMIPVIKGNGFNPLFQKYSTGSFPDECAIFGPDKFAMDASENQ